MSSSVCHPALMILRGEVYRFRQALVSEWAWCVASGVVLVGCRRAWGVSQVVRWRAVDGLWIVFAHFA
jgi:hypothetical protein